MMTNNSTSNNGISDLIVAKKLSEWLPSVIEGQGRRFLLPLDEGGGGEGLMDYRAPFKSDNILDGWKYARPRLWYHPLHRLAPYLGRFPPALARYFISKFSLPGEIIYDPFSGSGTVGLEALLLGRQAIANDVFIYAYTLSHAKMRPLNQGEFDAFLDLLKVELAQKKQSIEFDDRMLSDLLVYFHPDTLNQIASARSILSTMEHDTKYFNASRFVKAMICGILHGDSSTYLSVQTKDDRASFLL